MKTINWGYGFGWGGAPMGDPAYLPLAGLTSGQIDFDSLPDEVKEALERRSSEIYSAADIERIAREVMMRS